MGGVENLGSCCFLRLMPREIYQKVRLRLLLRFRTRQFYIGYLSENSPQYHCKLPSFSQSSAAIWHIILRFYRGRTLTISLHISSFHTTPHRTAICNALLSTRALLLSLLFLPFLFHIQGGAGGLISAAFINMRTVSAFSMQYEVRTYVHTMTTQHVELYYVPFIFHHAVSQGIT